MGRVVRPVGEAAKAPEAQEGATLAILATLAGGQVVIQNFGLEHTWTEAQEKPAAIVEHDGGRRALGLKHALSFSLVGGLWLLWWLGFHLVEIGEGRTRFLAIVLAGTTRVICSLASSACSAGCTPSFSARVAPDERKRERAIRSGAAASGCRRFLLGALFRSSVANSFFCPMRAWAYTQRPLLVGA